MNKRLFRIPIISIVLALCSLSGCSTPTNVQDPTEEIIPQSSEAFTHSNEELFSTEAIEDIAYIITIQINPHFEIYVDINGQITSIQPLNEDAKQLCTAVDVIHMTPEKGLYVLISQAHTDGFLEDGDTVDILLEYVHFSDESKMEHANSLTETVKTHLNLKQMPNVQISMNLRTRILPETQDSHWETQDDSSPAQQEDPYLLEFETSADGSYIYEKRYTEDGGTIEYHYSSSGYVHTSIYRDIIGSVETTHYNSQGQPTDSIFIRVDGAEIHQTYDDAWNVIHEVFYDANGSVITREFHPNFVLKSEHTLMADGSFSEVAWTETGIQIYSKEQYTNGREGYILCHENGIPKESYQKEPNGDYYLTIYDENGNETYVDYTREGKRVETMYNKDHSGTVITYYPDGTRETEYFNSNGLIKSGVDREGKSYIIVAGERIYE